MGEHPGDMGATCDLVGPIVITIDGKYTMEWFRLLSVSGVSQLSRLGELSTRMLCFVLFACCVNQFAAVLWALIELVIIFATSLEDESTFILILRSMHG